MQRFLPLVLGACSLVMSAQAFLPPMARPASASAASPRLNTASRAATSTSTTTCSSCSSCRTSRRGAWGAPVSSCVSSSSALSGASAASEPSVDDYSSTEMMALLVDREFQLEELEDSEGCTTSMTLNGDGTVTLGQTDGPLFQEGSWGKWELRGGERPIHISLTRTFDAKIEPYTVTRVLNGFLDEHLKTTDAIILSGDMKQHEGDDDDAEVGYWKAICMPGDASPDAERIAQHTYDQGAKKSKRPDSY